MPSTTSAPTPAASPAPTASAAGEEAEAALWLRIDMAGGRIGPGKVVLLEKIAELGSIAAAGRSLSMSYRRAWELVAELNRLLGSPVVRAASGGQRGGGAGLTELGIEVVENYRAIEKLARQAALPRLRALAARATT